jgi:hypothetical protein
MDSVDLCKKNGWAVGTKLIGNEGYGDTVIQITAIGERNLLAKALSHKGEPVTWGEGNWTLMYRDWSELK